MSNIIVRPEDEEYEMNPLSPLAFVSPDQAKATVEAMREVLSAVVPDDGKYFSVRYRGPDGKEKVAVFSGKEDAEKFARTVNGTISVRLTRLGTRVLGTVVGVTQIPAIHESTTQAVGNFLVTTHKGPGCTITVIADSDAVPVRADAVVSIAVGNRTFTGIGVAIRAEVGTTLASNLTAIAFTRALNRATQDALGVPSLSSEDEDADIIAIPDTMDGPGFMTFLKKIGVPLQTALSVLGMSNVNEIENFADAAREILARR